MYPSVVERLLSDCHKAPFEMLDNQRNGRMENLKLESVISEGWIFCVHPESADRSSLWEMRVKPK